MDLNIHTLMLSTLGNISQTLISILGEVLPLGLAVTIGFIVISMGIRWFLGLIGYDINDSTEDTDEFDHKWDREEKAVAYNDYVRHRIDDEEY